MIKREIFEKLENELSKKQITAVVGARQVGKTTALKYIYNKIKNESIFLTFEDTNILTLFENNINLFIEQYIVPYKYIFIDEFQYAKKGGKQLKLIYDTKYKKIFISGSSKPELAIHSLNYLVGRVSILEMYPLSFKEFVNFKSPEKNILFNKIRPTSDLEQLKAEFEEFIIYGGYPEVVLEPNFNEKEKIISNLIETYLFKEIKDILGFKENDLFENILKNLAIQNGKLTKISSISQNLNVSWNKIKECTNILSKTGITIQVIPFFSNKLKEIIKNPKTYFIDNGFVNGLLNNFNKIQNRSDKGEIYESFILQELIKQDIEPKFWNRQLSEVDFIIEKNNEITAIEIKSKIKKTPRSLKIFIEEYKPKKAYVFNENNTKTEIINKTKIELIHFINICSIKTWYE